MDECKKRRILVVDDEAGIRETMSLLLQGAGYKVSTASDGFDALLQIGNTVPELIISDLNMPKMSGFELLSIVRRRFPEITVIAISGANEQEETIPGGAIADAFHCKGQHAPQVLLRTVARLFDSSASREEERRRQPAPIWIPRHGRDSNGIPFVVLTCGHCLRSFSMNVSPTDTHKIHETSCVFCSTPIRYVIDFSVEVCAPTKRPIASSRQPERGSPE